VPGELRRRRPALTAHYSAQGVAPLWLPGATGDSGGRPALRRDLLPGGQLDPAGPNARARPDGPLYITKRMAPLASCCSSTRCAVTSSSGSGRPSRPVSVKPRPRQIGLDKPPEAVNNYNSRGTSVNPRCATVLFCFLSPLPLATAQTSALWTTYQHDSRHSGMAPFVGPQTDSGNLIFDLNGGIHLTQVAPTCCGFRTSWPEQS
jgi:hypothetical protein